VTGVHPALALREFPLFDGLPAEALEQLARDSRTLEVAQGDYVMLEGSVADGLYLLQEGRIEVSRGSGDELVVIGAYGPGVFLGEFSLLEHAPRYASVRALEPCVLLVVEPEAFEELLATRPAVSLNLLRTVMARLRDTEAAAAGHARLVSLGTLAAGLAHEINNPAAAVRRGLPQLEMLFDELGTSLLALAEEAAPAELIAPFDDCIGAAPPRPGSPAEAAAEDRLRAWLVRVGAAGPDELAPRLLAGGWSPESLESRLVGLPAAAAHRVLRWLGVRCAAHALFSELATSARAITDVVASVKQHAAPAGTGLRSYDVAAGIDAALLMLRGRMPAAVNIVRDVGADLPRVPSRGGELGQVWLNLIENALDAAGPGGCVGIHAAADGDTLHVRVTDDGPGIPAALRSRIFDPFFTTKESGTGLGLHIALSIVRRHQGSIDVASRPGHTVIDVRLPVAGARTAS
jgi:signal transduction histidine kinase